MYQYFSLYMLQILMDGFLSKMCIHILMGSFFCTYGLWNTFRSLEIYLNFKDYDVWCCFPIGFWNLQGELVCLSKNVSDYLVYIFYRFCKVKVTAFFLVIRRLRSLYRCWRKRLILKTSWPSSRRSCHSGNDQLVMCIGWNNVQ